MITQLSHLEGISRFRAVLLSHGWQSLSGQMGAVRSTRNGYSTRQRRCFEVFNE